MVYHGHVGHELLPGVTHVLKVLLTASLEFRVEQLRSRLKFDEGTARRQIEHRDKADTRRLMALFGNDWKDTSRYDMVLNLAMGAEAASDLITQAAKLKVFEETPASKLAFENLVLASTAHAKLLGSRQFHNLSINLKADKGELVVSGLVPRTVSDGEIAKILKSVPGVSKVTMDLLRIPERRSDIDW